MTFSLRNPFRNGPWRMNKSPVPKTSSPFNPFEENRYLWKTLENFYFFAIKICQKTWKTNRKQTDVATESLKYLK